MRCKLCQDGVFIGQDVSEVTYHVQLHHADVEEGEIQEIEFSCLLCCKHFSTSRQLNQHLLTHHTGKPQQITSVISRGNTSSPSRSKKRVFVENPEERVVDLRDKIRPAVKPTPIRKSSKSPVRSPVRNYSKSRSPLRNHSPPQRRSPERRKSPRRKVSRSPRRRNTRSPERSRKYSRSPPRRYSRSRSPSWSRYSSTRHYSRSRSGSSRSYSRSPERRSRGRRNRSGERKSPPPRRIAEIYRRRYSRSSTLPPTEWYLLRTLGQN